MLRFVVPCGRQASCFRVASKGSDGQPAGLGPELASGLDRTRPATHHRTRPQGGNVTPLSASGSVCCDHTPNHSLGLLVAYAAPWR